MDRFGQKFRQNIQEIGVREYEVFVLSVRTITIHDDDGE